MSAAPTPVSPGAALTYEVVVENLGPDAGTNVTLTDTLPLSVTLSSATSTQGTCTGSSIVTCALGSMASGTQVTVTLVVTPQCKPPR